MISCIRQSCGCNDEKNEIAKNKEELECRRQSEAEPNSSKKRNKVGGMGG